ncbi:MAG: hypothetical protein WC837_01370 [Bellilinea sp.]
MRFKRFDECKAIWLLLIIFGLSILSKIFIIPLLGAIWFPYSDEHLYIELAKSIYYHHQVFSNALPNIRQFNEILFPLVISPLYVFYSPDRILTIFRVFGLIAMSSAVFPAYQLGLAVLSSKKQAVLVAFFSVLIPEMTLAFSVIQEVIYYPLFLFTIYIIYKKISGVNVSSVFLGFLLFLLWVCKAAGATVLAGYIIFLGTELIFVDKFKHYKTKLTQIITVIVVVFGLKETLSLAIRYVNYRSFAAVDDFWTITASARLIDALRNIVSDFPNGVMYYLFFTTMLFMVFPFILPFDNLLHYERKDRKFLFFLTTSFLVTIATVVVLIYMDEGGAALGVQRVHYRYFFPYFIPFLVMMLKLDFSKLRFRQFGFIFSSILLIYYLLIQPQVINGSIIDAKSLLLFESLQNKVINGRNHIFIFAVLITMSLGFILYRKSTGMGKKLLAGVIGGFMLINHVYAAYDTYRVYSIEYNGVLRENEYSSLSKIVNSKPGTPLLIDIDNSLYVDALYSAQSNKDFIKSGIAENPLEYDYFHRNEQNFVITSKRLSNLSKIQNLELISTDLTLFNVYKLNETFTGKIKFDYIMLNTYADNWLMDNAKLLIAGVEGKNQIEVSLNLITDGHASDIVATLTDSTGKVSFASVSPNGEMVSIIVNKKPEEKLYELSLGSNRYFIPAELGLGADARKLTYKVTAVEVK